MTQLPPVVVSEEVKIIAETMGMPHSETVRGQVYEWLSTLTFETYLNILKKNDHVLPA